jgi:hypothetical protein
MIKGFQEVLERASQARTNRVLVLDRRSGGLALGERGIDQGFSVPSYRGGEGKVGKMRLGIEVDLSD